VTRIGHIALREFLATVATRGFIVGLLIFPVLIMLLVAVGPRLFSRSLTAPRVAGEIAIVDPTGLAAPALRAAIAPEALAERRGEAARLAIAATPPAMRDLAGADAGAAQRMVGVALGELPDLRLVERDAAADLQEAKDWLTAPPEGRQHLALVVIHPDAVAPADGGPYGGFDLYVRPNTDDRIEELVQRTVRETLIGARARAQGLDRDRIDAMMRVAGGAPVEVTATGERATARGFTQMLPAAFMFLMLVGVMMGGQGLLMSTVEEKSSRVVEVLLSAVSPFELMAGKLIGQMGVSLVGLSLYLALGAVSLLSFALLGLLDLRLIGYLLVFFVIAYLVNGSLMMAVGAAVNDMKEAQSLQGPFMIVIMIPWVLWFPISRDPNSTFATVVSLVPPVNSFAMLLRLASSAPPPWWQVWLSIGIGAGSVLAAVWFSAKVFRIGLLMHGTPPNLATLVRGRPAPGGGRRAPP
jgi:ABC-type Na+ efflux pump permease subunit